MRKKRFLAVVLSAAMVAGNTVMASAAITSGTYTDDGLGGTSYNATGSAITGAQATGTAQGTGYLTDRVDDRIFRVVVPTQRASGEADLFDFILDPQELIDQTSAAKYISGNKIDGAAGSKLVSVNTYEKGSLYFVNSANDGTKKLSPTSDALKIINKSTMKVDVSVNAHLTATSDIAISTDSTFAGNKEPAMYLGFIQSAPTQVAATSISAGDPNYIGEATLNDAKKFYVASTNASGTITYDIPSMNGTKPESSNEYATYEFKLTGTTNTAADWSDVASGSQGPQVDITYYLTEHVDKAPSLATANYTLQAGKGAPVKVNLGTGELAATGIASITFDNDSKTLPTDKYKFANGQLIFTADLVDTLLASADFTSRTYKVTFNDTAKTTANITLAK